MCIISLSSIIEEGIIISRMLAEKCHLHVFFGLDVCRNWHTSCGWVSMIRMVRSHKTSLWCCQQELSELQAARSACGTTSEDCSEALQLIISLFVRALGLLFYITPTVCGIFYEGSKGNHTGSLEIPLLCRCIKNFVMHFKFIK